MTQRQMSDYVLIIMKNLNLLAVLFLAGVMAASIHGHIQAGTSMDFMMTARGFTWAGWKIIVMAAGLYAACLLVMSMQSDSAAGLIIKISVEIILGFLVSYVLGFGYMGVILLILADTMKYFPKSKLKFPVAVVISFIYLFINYEFMSVYFDVIPLSVYLDYFQSDARALMAGLQNALTSLNTFVFLVYMIFLLWAQLDEKERILSLNRQLNEANSELQKANLQLEKYAEEKEQMVATRERNRLAREIHDTLGHALTGIITGTEASIALMDVAPDMAKEQLKVIAEVARQGITDVRRSVKALRPDALEKYDLEKAIYNIVEDMRNVSNIDIDYQCHTSLNGFNNDEEEIIYRIVQESITNAIRHGHATAISIDISRRYGTLIVRIADNGVGCADVKKGFGLHHMEERLNLLQGSLHYSGDRGFTIEARIPIRWGESGEEGERND
ncbi:sensor histidine kinase [Eubacterium sp. An3]|uniref:sensor histidine kinase n=1 Tax=Eubacterium sp. An3 TaxID=1965628 RepID=UPI00117B0A61|nr:sensor histidine kinase [Eubacterium sp. An3]